MQVHHISNRGTNQHEVPANWVKLCSVCHAAYHDGGPHPLTLGHILWAKQDESGYVDLEWLAMLRHKKHLGVEPTPLDDYYLGQRQRNQKGYPVP